MTAEGKKIRDARTKIKLSQAKLAKELGIVQAKLSQWELGKAKPTEAEFNQVMKTIDIIKVRVDNGEIRLNEKKFIHKIERKKNNPPKIPDATAYKKLISGKTYRTSSAENENFINELSKLGSVLEHTNLQLNQRAPKAIALFAGCGGLSLGFKSAGYNVIGHVEIDDAARMIYSANFPDSVCLGTDITQISDAEIYNWKQEYGHINVLFGGPPCQGFSLAGKRNPDDERNILFRDYLKIANILQPDAIVFENVRLMTSMKDSQGNNIFKQLLCDLDALGYHITYEELNSQYYGVPQARERVIVLGVNKNLGMNKVTLPEKTHASPLDFDLLSYNLQTTVTFKDAVGDLESLESGDWSADDPLHWAIIHPDHVLEWLKATPEGKSAHENTDPRLRPPSGYNTTYKRILWNEPCSTISTNFNMISGCRNVHPENTRTFTIREAARCQTFPDNFAFFGSWGDIRRVIGNAVPPLLGYKLAQHITSNILANPIPS